MYEGQRGNQDGPPATGTRSSVGTGSPATTGRPFRRVVCVHAMTNNKYDTIKYMIVKGCTSVGADAKTQLMCVGGSMNTP